MSFSKKIFHTFFYHFDCKFRFVGFEFDEIKLDLNPYSSFIDTNSPGIELEKSESNIKAPEKEVFNLKFDIW